MYKTCKHLEESLYIAPNEIRACCQRFFHKGKLRGDAKLIDIVDGKTPTTEDLLNSRNKIFDEIIEMISTYSQQIDVLYCSLQKKYNVYSFYPAIAKQGIDYSDIQNKIVDYNYLIK